MCSIQILKAVQLYKVETERSRDLKIKKLSE